MENRVLFNYYYLMKSQILKVDYLYYYISRHKINKKNLVKMYSKSQFFILKLNQ